MRRVSPSNSPSLYRIRQNNSQVCVYLASLNSCTSHCGSSIWLGAFLENRRRPQKRHRLTLTCLTVFTVMLGKPPHQKAPPHHNRDGVKATTRAIRVGSSEYSDYIQNFGSDNRRRGQPKKQQGDERPRHRLCAGGRSDRTRRLRAA